MPRESTNPAVVPPWLSVDLRIDTVDFNAFTVGFPMKTVQHLTIGHLHCAAKTAMSWLVIVMIPSMTVASPVRSGEQIYRQQCASCHGAKGEGTDDHYPRALVGERSVSGLAGLIAKTMPEDAPGDCVGKDAEKVAAYIYDSFYSRSAQARNKFEPSRIELSRLTVRQYKNAVADLLGSFQAAARLG